MKKMKTYEMYTGKGDERESELIQSEIDREEIDREEIDAELPAPPEEIEIEDLDEYGDIPTGNDTSLVDKAAEIDAENQVVVDVNAEVEVDLSKVKNVDDDGNYKRPSNQAKELEEADDDYDKMFGDSSL